MKYPIFVCITLALGGCATAAGPVASSPSGEAPLQPAPKQVAAEKSAPSQAKFAQWVAKFRAEAAQSGVDEATLAAAFDHAQLVPRVLKLDSTQPEFTRSIWDYLDSAVSDIRVNTGRTRLAANLDAAQAAQDEYGVPKEVLVAIWGIESNYGSNFGTYETIDSLATLGYDGRREKFARRELLAALQILQSGDIDRDHMIGSWAGAMGQTQFLPSSFQAYAVDADGDGRRDIWGSIDDVMASTANYLAKAHWQPGEPWGVEVVLPQGFDYAAADLSTELATGEWQALGVRAANGQPLPGFDEASVIVPAGARGPAFLVGPNFRAILRYNNSTSYGLAVAHLADRIAGGGPFVAAWPRGLASLSRTQVKQMQSLLNAKGYAAGTPDGLAGANTRRALRKYQRSQGLVADGYPTFALLQAMQQK